MKNAQPNPKVLTNYKMIKPTCNKSICIHMGCLTNLYYPLGAPHSFIIIQKWRLRRILRSIFTWFQDGAFKEWAHIKKFKAFSRNKRKSKMYYMAKKRKRGVGVSRKDKMAFQESKKIKNSITRLKEIKSRKFYPIHAPRVQEIQEPSRRGVSHYKRIQDGRPRSFMHWRRIQVVRFSLF